MDSETSAKEILLTNCAMEECPLNLQVEAMNMHCNDMLRGKYQEKNVMEFCKCLTSNQYAQLKAYAHRLISVLAAPICVTDIFKAEMGGRVLGVSLQMFICYW